MKIIRQGCKLYNTNSVLLVVAIMLYHLPIIPKYVTNFKKKKNPKVKLWERTEVQYNARQVYRWMGLFQYCKLFTFLLCVFITVYLLLL